VKYCPVIIDHSNLDTVHEHDLDDKYDMNQNMLVMMIEFSSK